MIVSWNWLAQYVKLDMPVEELTHRLAMAGFNHEGTEDVEGDLAIDLEVTSNRADCLSHLGIAREIAVLYERATTPLDPRPNEGGVRVETRTAVTVEQPELCPLFTSRVVSGVKIGPSPWWMQRRLKTLGVRPISNIVDITNYVLFECGQPLHAYDLDQLRERRLVVRLARPGESLKAINGRDYPLGGEMLVIADSQRPVGLAGVMGGLETEIGPTTQNLLIEAAVFDPVSIRKTARALGLHSPSSFRFERGIDPERTEWASRRCAELILDLAGGTLHPGVIAVGNSKRDRPIISLRLAQLSRILGIEVPRDRVPRILESLGLEPLDQREEIAKFRPPSWRPDLEREIDLIEEIARIHGYEHIPEDRNVPLIGSSRGLRERVEEHTRAVLTGLGFDEAYTHSLVSEQFDAPLVVNEPADALRVDHSTRKKENTLRRGLVPSLLAARAFNEAHGTADAALFEIASVYLPRGGRPMPDEPVHLALASGLDFLGIKGVIECLLDRLHVSGSLTTHAASQALLMAGQAAELRLDGESLGFVGAASPKNCELVGLRQVCTVAELDFDRLVACSNLVPAYRPLPDHPAVGRDLSLVVDRNLPWAELADVVRQAAGPTLESITFLDTFESRDLPEGRHSLHFGMRFRHAARTLTGDEVEGSVEQVIQACRNRLDATLRA